jgi:hypothetical protein
MYPFVFLLSCLKKKLWYILKMSNEIERLVLENNIRILEGNVRDLQEQLQNAYKRMKELGENNEQTTRKN